MWGLSEAKRVGFFDRDPSEVAVSPYMHWSARVTWTAGRDSNTLIISSSHGLAELGCSKKKGPTVVHLLKCYSRTHVNNLQGVLLLPVTSCAVHARPARPRHRGVGRAGRGHDDHGGSSVSDLAPQSHLSMVRQQVTSRRHVE